MTKRPADDEPEPIDAEFEPASGPEPKRTRRTGGRPLRSRSATIQELVISSALAAVLGGTVAIIASNASSNAPTGTLAREIDSLVRGQGDLVARADQAAADVVALRSRLDAQGERLDQQNATEAALRSDLTRADRPAFRHQRRERRRYDCGFLGGEVPARHPAQPHQPAGGDCPRKTRPRRRPRARCSAPSRTVIASGGARSCEQHAGGGVRSPRGRAGCARKRHAIHVGRYFRHAWRQTLPARPAGVAAVSALPPPPILAATARSQAIRALSALEAAARSNMPFAREHQALATLLPNEMDLINMADAARTGVPTVAQLRSDFAAAADRSIRVATNKSDDGWNWLRTAFIGVVEFEPSEMVATNSEIIRNARRQLDLGDVSGAIEAVTSVSGDAGAPLRTWRTQALKRAMLDRESQRLERAAAGDPQRQAEPRAERSRNEIAITYADVIALARMCSRACCSRRAASLARMKAPDGPLESL